jgi:hypothetical protein
MAGTADEQSPSVPPGDRDDPVWQRRVACAEVNGRQVNEAIARGRRDPAAATFLCECGRLGCTTKLELGIADYERARTSFDRFVLAPDHEIAPVDEVIVRRPGFIIVAKRGPAAQVAQRTDERTPDADPR